MTSPATAPKRAAAIVVTITRGEPSKTPAILSRETQDGGVFDRSGAVLTALAVGGLAFGTMRGQASGWGIGPLALIGVGVAACVLFPLRMRRAADPLVPLELFRSRNFTVTNISTFLVYGR